jgi:hypothetical protein
VRQWKVKPPVYNRIYPRAPRFLRLGASSSMGFVDFQQHQLQCGFRLPCQQLRMCLGTTILSSLPLVERLKESADGDTSAQDTPRNRQPYNSPLSEKSHPSTSHSYTFLHGAGARPATPLARNPSRKATCGAVCRPLAFATGVMEHSNRSTFPHWPRKGCASLVIHGR